MDAVSMVRGVSSSWARLVNSSFILAFCLALAYLWYMRSEHNMPNANIDILIIISVTMIDFSFFSLRRYNFFLKHNQLFAEKIVLQVEKA